MNVFEDINRQKNVHSFVLVPNKHISSQMQNKLFFSKIHFKWEIISTGFVVFAESVIKMECKQINVNTIVKMLSIMTLTWKALEKLILFIEDIEKFIFEETNIYFKHFCNTY